MNKEMKALKGLEKTVLRSMYYAILGAGFLALINGVLIFLYLVLSIKINAILWVVIVINILVFFDAFRVGISYRNRLAEVLEEEKEND